jgi:hypothetical protein
VNTLLLSPAWDLTLNAAGNIATAYDGAPVSPDKRALYALAQDVASATRLFLGELWYDTTQGVPYFQRILGHLPPAELLKAQLVVAGKTVPGVAGIVVTFSSFTNRNLAGRLNITSDLGTGFVTFGATPGTAALPWYINAAAVLG